MKTTRARGRRSFLGRVAAAVAATVAAPQAAAAQAAGRRRSTTPRRRTPAPTKRPAASAAAAAPSGPPPRPQPVAVARGSWPVPQPGAPIDLAPARWLWLPCERTLANTFVLFRRELEIAGEVASARGFISADSRYRLFVNGRRVQFGPAPCDPRSYEADPMDLAAYLVPGRNVIGVEVLYYGHGEGTWPGGKPGFVFALRVEDRAGGVHEVVSDASWRARLDRAHRPGQFKRWYLRSLQEDYDARLAPMGWSEPDHRPDAAWLAPAVLELAADRPAAAGPHYDYLTDGGIAAADAVLRAREVPLLRETMQVVGTLVRSGRVRWLRDPRDWFEYRLPGCFEIVDQPSAEAVGDGIFTITLAPGEAAFATFALAEQVVGFPFVAIEAAEGTVVEILTQESHDPRAAAWLDSHRFAWTRLVCRQGENRFEAFDYESLRFLQLHVRETSGPVTIRGIGVRRRSYPWPAVPRFVCGDPAVQRVLEASFNTLVNSAQETIVDGMGRERQQYSGDGAHQLHATRLVGGDLQLARRFLRTFPLGQTREGYFLDCWPAWDRLNRIAQREVGATRWGPLLDHGVTLVYDAWRHHMETGDRAPVADLYPSFVRFAEYLLAGRARDGLLPVEGWGVPAVWIDNGYPRQRHKQCAFNLFSVAVLRDSLAPIAKLAGDAAGAQRWTNAARELLAAAVRRFWSEERGLFVANLPWEDEEGEARLDDRSLATALLFDLCPSGQVAAAVQALAAPGPSLSLSYPANSHWRMQALARQGRVDAVLAELRTRWASLPAVLENRTTPEDWDVRHDTSDQWSHCAVGPLFVAYMDLAGIRPALPGFERVWIRPQLGDLPSLDLTCHTVRGPIVFSARRDGKLHTVRLALPPECAGELLLPEPGLEGIKRLGPHSLGLVRHTLPPGEAEFQLPAI